MTYPHTEKRTCDCCCLVLDDKDIVYKCSECGGECCVICMPNGQPMPDHKDNKCIACIARDKYHSNS